jgi:hypothetical protein
MSILKNFSIILVGLTATVCQAEIAIEAPPPEEPFENSTVPSGEAPSESELKVAPLRLALDLADGSHIIGVPSITSIPVQTSYAKMDIPLEKIVSIEIKDDHETASIELQNGDKLKGVVDLSAIELKTIFGKHSIGVEHITNIQVSRERQLSATIKKGLVLYYSFDEGKKDKVADLSGKMNEGTVYGAERTSKGKKGGGCEFNGSSDYIESGGKSFLNVPTGEALTVSLWVNVDSVGTQDTIVIGKTGLRADNEWAISVSPDLTIGFLACGPRKGNAFRMMSYSAKVKAGRWYHVTGVIDKGVAWMCVNAVRQRSFLQGVGHDGIGHFREPVANSDPFRIGRSSHHRQPRFFHGSLDEVMIWRRALSEDEIKQVYRLTGGKGD